METSGSHKRAALPKPKEVKKKHKTTTHEIEMQAHPNYNKQLTDILDEMGMVEKNRGQVHKYKAYAKAVRALKAHPSKITSGKEASALDGIGKKIAAKIDEILESGHLNKLDKELEDERTKAINEVAQVSGIGPAAAKKLVDEDGIKGLEDLKNNYHKLNNHQQIGLKYFDDFKQRIPRAEVQKIEKIVIDTLKEIDEQLTGITCGSYRRGAATSGDIDVLITHPDFHEDSKKKAKYLEVIVEELRKRKLLTDDMSCGNLKYMGVCKLEGTDEEGKPYIYRRIDLRLIPTESFWCGLMYFTGSDFFNTQMRIIALEKNFTLSEYSLCPLGENGAKGDPVPINSEEDIFSYLGMKYKTPEERNL